MILDLKGFPRMKSEVGDRDDAGGARGQVQRGSQSRVQKQGPRSETEPLPEEPGPNRSQRRVQEQWFHYSLTTLPQGGNISTRPKSTGGYTGQKPTTGKRGVPGVERSSEVGSPDPSNAKVKHKTDNNGSQAQTRQ